MATLAELQLVLKKHFEVELCDGLLSVSDCLVDVSDFPWCSIVGEDPISSQELIRTLHYRKLEEQAEQAGFRLYELDEGNVVARGTLALQHKPHILKAWNLQEEPIDVSCTISLDTLDMKLTLKQSQPSPILQTLESQPHQNLLELRVVEVELLPFLNRYCCVCAKQHDRYSDMLMLFPCANQLCLYISHTQKIGNRVSESSLALLAKLLLAALKSARQDLICDPFPLLFKDAHTHLLHPSEQRDIPLATQLSEQLVERGWASVDDQRLGYWLMISTKSYIIEQREHPFQPNQLFLVLAASPEEEARFAALKQEHGACYAFHGSPFENWHSVLHNGLKNASGTKLQLHGAAYGAGIYLSPSSSTSASYSHWLVYGTQSFSGDRAMAIVEVINKDIRKNGDIWVQPEASMVQIRFLLVGHQPVAHVKIESIAPELDALCNAVY